MLHGDGVEDELWPAKYLKEPDLKARRDPTTGRTALVILNSPIPDYDYFYRLYNHASFCLCADGGADRLYSLLTNHKSGLDEIAALKQALPDIIHGDLDSLSDGTRSVYESLAVEVSQDPDQYSTDFGKAMNKVIERLPGIESMLVLGSIGGRVDQGVGLLGELYREQTVRHPGIRFWLFSEASSGLLQRNIGILPLYGPAVITTEGLEWDVQDWSTEMGGQMSTSNHIVADEIGIFTDNEVLFTVERATGR
ncbi:thiamine pyrophosphokinase [Saxophila tyrrhenica]|uniref:Thiamine pyrophosphokinase n=1 Tax=Saxophila tyrrhenica TaxID=1690608 RepID=A0AAV9PRU0_9PEZI|nr:thiamine pyrophosphokinase [Saxophila tyrrhenica]